MSTITEDGTLTEDEALAALRTAAQAATEALPKALAQCTTDEQRAQIIGDRDKVVLAYLNSLHSSLVHTGAIFEKLAEELEAEAQNVSTRKDKLTTAVAAIGLLGDLVKFAASLALAFA